jgi:CheY-like chemotaxis protein
MKFLIIDDEPLVRRSLKRALEIQGHEVDEAQDGLEGLKKWESMKPDLVFLDVLMPVMSGPALLQEIGARKGSSKVVLISAYAGDYNLETTKKMGADLFVSKPFEDIFALVKIAEEILK